MTQYFSIYEASKLYTDPYKQFLWYEDDDGNEKYGFLYSASVVGCLNQIKNEIYEQEFEINISLSDKKGGCCVITTLQELEAAKIKYAQFM